MRLTKFEQALLDYPIYVLPIQMNFLFSSETTFTELIANFITTFKHKNQESDAGKKAI